MKRSNRTLRSVLSLLLAVAMCLTLALPALAAGGETTFDGVYRLVNAVNADQRVAPGNDSVQANNGLYIWEQEAGRDPKVAMFQLTDAGDGMYYIQPLLDDTLVIQGSDTVTLQTKDEANADQKWTVTQVDGGYSFCNDKGYLSTDADSHSQVDISATEKVWVLDEVQPEMKLTLSSGMVEVGSTVTATVSGTDNKGDALDTTGVVLESDNIAVATVDGATITAVGEGTATITAKLEVNGQTVTATAKLEVVAQFEEVEMNGIYLLRSVAFPSDIAEPGGDQIYTGNTLWLWPHGSQDTRMWIFTPAGDGTVYWQPYTNRSLAVRPVTAGAAGEDLGFSALADNDPLLRWRILPADDGSYYLQNVGSGLYMCSKTDKNQSLLSLGSKDAVTAKWTFEAVPDSIDLQLSSSAVMVGEQTTATAAVISGTDANAKAVLESSDPAIASVDGMTITGHKTGTVTITAKVEGGAEDSPVATVTFHVLQPSVEWGGGLYRIDGGILSGIVEPSAANVSANVVLYFWGNALDSARMYRFSEGTDGAVFWHPQSNLGLAMEARSDGYIYLSNYDPNSAAQQWKLVAVDGKEGIYTFQNVGTGTYMATQDDASNKIIIQTDDTSLQSAQWKVTELLPTISMALDALYLQVGNSTQADVTAKDAAGNTVTTGITVISANPEIASVNGTTVTGVSAGRTTITAQLVVGDNTYTSEPVAVTVTEEENIFTGMEWYKDIETPEVNREPSHADFIPYPDAQTAMDAERSALDDVDENSSDYYQLLTQTEWDFALVENPAQAAEADAAGWLDEVLPEGEAENFNREFVPSTWQTYRNEDGTFRYFDEAIYTNSVYPWGSVPGNYIDYDDPQAPTYYNPVGYYRTTFTLPENWDGREIFLSFQGVKSAYYLYVNGHQVGYTTDSYTAHDFNITPYLNAEGENTVAVKVFRWSIGSYLENQDMIQQSGIIRDVYLYSKDSQAEIRDFFVQTKFDDRTSKDSNVTLKVDVDVRNLTNEVITDGYTVDVTLRELDGTVVGSDTLTYDTLTALNGVTGATDPTAEAADGEKKVNLGDRQTAEIYVINPEKWFPDTPNLYMITIELKDADGQVVEVAAERIGFREIYKVNINEDGQEQMQITGQKIIFRGVNRHDTSMENGDAVTRQEMIDDLMLMKQFNVNAIRTSHYPNNKLIYDLADELGLYVYAEANVESHYGGYGDHEVAIPGEDARWVWPVMDRNMNMVELLKNHAAIIGWSYSNESTYTTIEWNDDYCFWATAMAILERDPSRLRMYERESHNYYHPYVKPSNDADPWSYEVRSQNVVDVHSTQYPEASAVKSWASDPNNKLPYFEQEYEHAMGQAFGSFEEFWKLNRTMENVQGGFIWDWVDQTLETTRVDEDGNYETFWGYGGDWIDGAYNADAFCGNGVFFANRTPSSKAIEMRYVHQQVNFYLIGEDVDVTDGSVTVQVVNEYENTNLDAFDITWTLIKDDEAIATGKLDLATSCMDGSQFGVETVTIDLPEVEVSGGDNYLLEFSVTNKERPDWDASTWTYNNEVAFEQFDLTPAGAERDALNYSDMLDFTAVDETEDTLTVSGITDEGQVYSFEMSKTTGIISNYTLDGEVVLEQGPVPSYWRAQTYNDTPVMYDAKLRNDENTMTLKSAPVITVDGKHIKVELDVQLPVDADQTMRYDIYANGEIVVSSAFTPNSNFAPGTAGTYALPKVGLRMTVVPGYENFTFYGPGPEETYVDRQNGSKVGLYESTVSEEFVDEYLKPQENGNHTSVRWSALTNEDGNGLMVSADGTVETSALHVKAEDINPSTYAYPYNAQTIRHSTEVPMEDVTYWCVDAMQRGVSNTAFFNHVPLEGYYPTTKPNADGTYQTYSETFRISPVTAETDLVEESKLGFTAEELGVTMYTVTFETNNGVAATTVEVARNQTVAQPEQPTNGDFTFEGWFTDAECTQAYDFTQPVRKDLTLYAGWKMVGPSVDRDDEDDIDDGEIPLDPTPGFADVSDSHWAKEAIDYVVEEGLFTGTSETTFAPEMTTTRAMLMTVLARMDGVDTTGSDPWYQKGMEWAVTEGVSDGTNPEATITREQLAVMLYRYAGSPAVGDEALDFSDADQVSAWAADGMKWAVANGIVSGKGNGVLDPQGSASRAEVAQMLWNFSKIG